MKTTISLLITLGFITSLYSEPTKVVPTTNVFQEQLIQYFDQHIRSLSSSSEGAEVVSDGNIYQVVQARDSISGFSDSFTLKSHGDSFNSNFNNDIGTSSFILEEITEQGLKVSYRTIFRSSGDGLQQDVGSFIIPWTERQ